MKRILLEKSYIISALSIYSKQVFVQLTTLSCNYIHTCFYILNKFIDAWEIRIFKKY